MGCDTYEWSEHSVKYFQDKAKEKANMATCPMCNSEITNDNPALKQAAFQEYADRFGWDRLASLSVGKTFRAGNYQASIESTKTDPGYPSRYGEYDQGTTFEAHVVVAVEGVYFKKTGTGDSYGDISWDGPVKQVTPKEKVVKTFE